MGWLILLGLIGILVLSVLSGAGLTPIGWLILLSLIGILGMWFWLQEDSKNRIYKAETEYKNSLAQLHQDPTNPQLRAETLTLGRRYSNIARNSKGVTIFDEIALMNDINAACAGASVQHTRSKKDTIEERLERLERLKKDGYLSEKEYAYRKNQILDDI